MGIYNEDGSLNVNSSPAPATNIRRGFESTVASGVDANEVQLVRTGSGMTVSQGSGSLVINAGTTAYDETIIRILDDSKSILSLSGRFKAVWGLQLSQRVANQEFAVEFVDLVGSQIPFTITNTTTVVVRFPTRSDNPFSSLDIGQSVHLGNSTLGSVQTQRGVLATVTDTTATFTVTGYPASGSGLIDLWGWNFHRIVYDGTTATNAKFSNGSMGYYLTDITSTINTTATASSHIGYLSTEGLEVVFGEKPGASVTTGSMTQRASSVRNIPHEYVKLICQIRVTNYSTAPASATTLTFNFINIDATKAHTVILAAVDNMSKVSPLPVSIEGAGSTVATNTTLQASSNLSNDVGVQARATGTAFSITRLLTAAASTNSTLVKGSSGKLQKLTGYNAATSVRYLKLYNKATAPTIGTDTPVVTLALAPSSAFELNLADIGHVFSTGIGFGLTTAVADSDTTALTAGDILGLNIFYL